MATWRDTLNSRNYSFTAQVDDIVKRVEIRMIRLSQASFNELIETAQTPGPSKKSIAAGIAKGLGRMGRKKRDIIQGPITAPGKGGKMRVDTGFLRASGRLSYDGMPTGPLRPTKGESYTWSQSEQVTVKLQSLQIGQTVYFGWTANYAKYREAYDGFLISAIQDWQRIVDSWAEKIKARVS